MQEFCFSGNEFGKQILDLRAALLGIREDVTLVISCGEEGWILTRGRNWHFLPSGPDTEPVPENRLLENDQLLSLGTQQGERLFLFYRERPLPQYFSLPKISLSHMRRVSIGKNPDNEICYDFKGMVSGVHLVLERGTGGWYLNGEGTNGVYKNGRQIMEREKLSYGDKVCIPGLSMLYLGDTIASNTDIPVPQEMKAGIRESMIGQDLPGDRKKTETPEIQHKETDSRQITVPVPFRQNALKKAEEMVIQEPWPREHTSLSPLFLEMGGAFGMFLPMIMASLMVTALSPAGADPSGYLISGLSFSLSYAVISLTWMVASRRYQEKRERQAEERREAFYRTYLEEKLEKVRAVYEDSVKDLLLSWPSAAECLLYDEKNPRLWCCVRTPADPLRIRIGTGTLPFPGKLSFPEEELCADPDPLRGLAEGMFSPYLQMEGVPFCLDLREHRAVGVNFGTQRSAAVRAVLSLVICAAASYCYQDVKLAVVWEPGVDRNVWEPLRWLPHVWSAGNRIRYLAENEAQARELCAEMLRLQEERDNQTQYLFLIAHPDWVRGEPLMNAISGKDSSGRITALFVSADGEWIPSFCSCFLTFDGEVCRVREGDAGHDRQEQVVRPDSFPIRDLEHFTRKLADLRTDRKERNESIPEQVSFFELYEIEKPEDLMVHQRWRSAHTSEEIRARIGKEAGDRITFLDLHEKKHGPHGLAAGTTGSGKSELLQTLLLSLAVEYSPEDVAFFLIDYKGGGMSGAFRGLPHLAGEVSNLSGSNIGRALAALRSENRRRQSALARAGVNHIDAYIRRRKQDEKVLPMPHLVIVVDEFAELKKENPEFLEELISVAQVGRSLGIHLILSTQKPQGIVDERIRSNTRFRLCLRVQETAESMDMVRRPDAAFFRQPGRCCLEIGNEEVFEIFQSAYSAARWDPCHPEKGKRKTALVTLGGQRISVHYKKQEEKEQGITELEAVCRYLKSAADLHGFQKAACLWLPELGKNLYLEELQAMSAASVFHGNDSTEGYKVWRPEDTTKPDSEKWFQGGEIMAPAGMLDHPSQQRQMPLYLLFPQMRHLAVIGAGGSGKSTFLQTAVLSLACSCAPDRINLYLVDYGGGQLGALKTLPHSGGVCLPGDPVPPLLNLLREIILQRKEQDIGGDFYRHEAQDKDAPPVCFLVIDEYGTFREQTGGCYDDELLWIAKEGPRCGVHMIVSAGENQIPLRLSEQLLTAVALGLPERLSYMEVLQNCEIPIVPDRRIKGRGLAVWERQTLEFQTAIPVRTESGFRREECLAELGKKMALRWNGRPAVKIPRVPKAPGSKEFFEHPETNDMLRSGLWIPVGYDLQTARIAGVRLDEIFCFLISGGVRAGKKNLLRIWIQSALQLHARVILIDLSGRMRSFRTEKEDEENNLLRIRNTDEMIAFFEKELTPVYKERNERVTAYESEGFSREEIFRKMKKEQPLFVCFADLEEVIQADRQKETGVEEFLTGLFQRGAQHQVYFIGILDVQGQQHCMGNPVYNTFAGWNTGIHLGGNVAAVQDLTFAAVSYTDQTKKEKPGIGQLSEPLAHMGNGKIQIPMAWR